MNPFSSFSCVNADDAFRQLVEAIKRKGENSNGTRRLLNCSILIANPVDNHISASYRKWSLKYAMREFIWYMSGDRSVERLIKHAPIWDKMHNGDYIVNSNYGWQWLRNEQYNLTVEQLRANPKTRQAFISIFDGKEKSEYSKDTPCTLTVGFVIHGNKLCMTVNMRSNDLWYGFCNDQYCFSELQKMTARKLGLEVGWYYHHATDMHLYDAQLELVKYI